MPMQTDNQSPTEVITPNTFKLGDVVRLKSGGPSMTISLVLSNNAVECVWFPNDLQIVSNTFRSDTLQTVSGVQAFKKVICPNPNL